MDNKQKIKKLEQILNNLSENNNTQYVCYAHNTLWSMGIKTDFYVNNIRNIIIWNCIKIFYNDFNSQIHKNINDNIDGDIVLKLHDELLNDLNLLNTHTIFS